MNYKLIHDRIILNALNAERCKGNGDYYESHHITPKCVGGTDSKDNLVLLTPKEHYIIHHLLTKIYPDEAGLKVAYSRIVYRYGYQKTLRMTARMYERAKAEHAKVMSDRTVTCETRRRMSESAKARCTEEWRQSKSEQMSQRTGEDNPFFGKKHSQETKDKIGAANKGRLKGNKNPMYGTTMSEEHKQKLRNVLMNREYPEEAKKKQSEAMSKLKWVTDGVNNKRLDHLPDGWKYGRSSK